MSQSFLNTPFERASASISSRFHLIDCHVLRVCYYCEYSLSTLILLLFWNLSEVTDQPKAEDDNQSNDIPNYSKQKSSRFAFDLDSDYPSRQKGDKAMRKLDFQPRMLELKHQWELLRAEDNSNSDDSMLTEVAGERREKSSVLYEKSSIKPDGFPGKDFNRWDLWMKHYKSVAKANG